MSNRAGRDLSRILTLQQQARPRKRGLRDLLCKTKMYKLDFFTLLFSEWNVKWDHVDRDLTRSQ
jgi:hypothetical protein